jgi:exodeoxyribonuclease V alpha subunit
VAGLNEAVETRLESAGLVRRRGEWYVGRPVMVTRNDYATGVYNGDIGLTLPDPQRPGSLRVWFGDGETVRSVLATRLRNVDTAFAMTVHKSQGSEFTHTVMVLPAQASAVLTRELVYTGITRARERFTLVSPNAAVLDGAIAARTRRASGLREALGT